MHSRYEKTYSVRHYEVDADHLLKPAVVFDYLQDAASDHAGVLGCSIADLQKQDRTWVISRYHVRILDYPSWQTPLKLRTWPCPPRGLFAFRDFIVSDAHEQPVVLATSAWLVLDAVRRRPLRPEDALADYPVREERALDDEFSPLPRPERVDLSCAIQPRMADLDVNGHVNNTLYFSWALEALPEALRVLRPRDIEVAYRAEAMPGDPVEVRTQVTEDADAQPLTIHQIANAATGRELTRLRIGWR